ncbi:RNA ligase RtcB family protein [Pseudomonas chlororaphis]|uniref:3'-phosphate/5'-hydroxy nucleic acid ligase n=1 Tax=Pseudomonas chlororaphis TaxID=587753 RepID=A0AAX3FRC5_9PSED|nr:RNA ligase RtcB family protein [Pseudomonas chlororaphis]AZC38833.1 RtcB-like protein [Pseudomonas chlororaphis subsp. piscium]AZC45383.1 RtcB-like protein [Pseudomonas chlororaphis subsp. piscium]UCR83695.1 RNA ligase RtcB family protein [Pseudomonas chlororaphis]WDG70945.1 RNA ligase RtcB family protein [Pseudomonas chlororaphis]WDH31269.1 RNA ligase RtcB family protein [Pseudomonas chlororaphis]
MGNCIRNLSAGVSLVASDSTWIEDQAIQQLQTTAKLQGMQRVVGMPDLHPGRGYPVGAAFFSSEILYPALVGNDIGCGMALWQTDISSARLNLDKLEKKIGNIDTELDEHWQEDLAQLGFFATGHEHALGTIGGGNHFAELQQIDEVHSSELMEALELDPKSLLLLVHSGSRGLGEAILRRHIDRHGHDGIAVDCEAGIDYLQRHDEALRFAQANRRLIAERILVNLRARGRSALDINHNLVSPATVEGVSGWIHRKGATPSDQGVVVIPGSRGDYSYLVQPVPHAASLYSLAHGAGRKWIRGDCKGRLASRFSFDQLKRTALGSRVICEDRGLMYEEAPEAYKSIDSVVGSLLEAGLIRIIARLKPILTYKRRGCC